MTSIISTNNVNIGELEKEWNLHKKTEKSKISDDFFNAMNLLFQKQDFRILTRSNESEPKSILVVKECNDHKGYVAAIVSRDLEKNRIAIVQDENTALQLYKSNTINFDLKDNLLILAGLTFCTTILGAPVGYYLANSAGVVGESVKSYVVGGVEIGFGISLLGGSICTIYNYFKHRGYNKFQKQLPFKSYKGSEAIDLILNVKDGDYKSAFK
jgi:hypothetical protein